MRKSPEHDAQRDFITWCGYSTGAHPELAHVFAIPNGGHRHKATAAKLKAEGVKAGVPDLFLPVARGGYHGLFMETKIKPNKPTAKQVDWLDALQQLGYAAEVCYGYEGLVECVNWYLGLSEDEE